MAKKSEQQKAEALKARIAHLCSTGNVRQAAEEIASAKPKESQFDELMEIHPGLRLVWQSL
jgi:hypothetical protein